MIFFALPPCCCSASYKEITVQKSRTFRRSITIYNSEYLYLVRPSCSFINSNTLNSMKFVLNFVKICHLVQKLKGRITHTQHGDFISQIVFLKKGRLAKNCKFLTVIITLYLFNSHDRNVAV